MLVPLYQFTLYSYFCHLRKMVVFSAETFSHQENIFFSPGPLPFQAQKSRKLVIKEKKK